MFIFIVLLFWYVVNKRKVEADFSLVSLLRWSSGALHPTGFFTLRIIVAFSFAVGIKIQGQT